MYVILELLKYTLLLWLKSAPLEPLTLVQFTLKVASGLALIPHARLMGEPTLTIWFVELNNQNWGVTTCVEGMILYSTGGE